MAVTLHAFNSAHRSSRGLGPYVLACCILLPIDWFQPTGDLFREFGAKPASLLLVAGGVMGWLRWARRFDHLPQMIARAMLLLGAIVACGAFGATLNLMFQWSGSGYARTPQVQFVLQTALLLACVLAVTGNALLFHGRPVMVLLARALPWAAAAHLAVFALEALGIVPDDAGLLLLFRSDGGLIERPTGLTSEPSYFGTLAALFGAALVALPAPRRRRLLNRLLALALVVSALAISAKTMVAVMAVQVIGLLVMGQTMRERLAAVLLALVATAAGVYFVVTYSAFDLEDNLSSAMRLGSSALAANAALDGYGVFGIGTGQFHYFYRDAYAPSFLFASPEALNQLDPGAEGRASTFNMFLRLWLESGIAGILLLAWGVLRLLQRSRQQETRAAVLMLTGALGFLLTQDTYFYPPLVFSAAILLACATRRARRVPRRRAGLGVMAPPIGADVPQTAPP